LVFERLVPTNTPSNAPPKTKPKVRAFIAMELMSQQKVFVLSQNLNQPFSFDVTAYWHLPRL